MGQFRLASALIGSVKADVATWVMALEQTLCRKSPENLDCEAGHGCFPEWIGWDGDRREWKPL